MGIGRGTGTGGTGTGVRALPLIEFGVRSRARSHLAADALYLASQVRQEFWLPEWLIEEYDLLLFSGNLMISPSISGKEPLI
jgi:hypothetical protein